MHDFIQCWGGVWKPYIERAQSFPVPALDKSQFALRAFLGCFGRLPDLHLETPSRNEGGSFRRFRKPLQRTPPVCMCPAEISSLVVLGGGWCTQSIASMEASRSDCYLLAGVRRLRWYLEHPLQHVTSSHHGKRRTDSR